jgi:hypothetical protein
MQTETANVTILEQYSMIDHFLVAVVRTTILIFDGVCLSSPFASSIVVLCARHSTRTSLDQVANDEFTIIERIVRVRLLSEIGQRESHARIEMFDVDSVTR